MKTKQAKDFQCLECGRKLTTLGAAKAMNDGCPGCGGVDIDLAPVTSGRLASIRGAK